MSKIKVWTSDGEWSKEVEGLDKIHFMKETIHLYAPCVDENDEPVLHPLMGFEIDSKELNDDFEMQPEKFMDEDTGEMFTVDPFWRRFCVANGGDIVSKAKTFKLPLPALKSMKKHDPLCAALYDELLTAAKVPATASKDYCLLFKFEDE